MYIDWEMADSRKQAAAWVEFFPEAEVFSVSVLSADKTVAFMHKPRYPRASLLQQIAKWVPLADRHVFARPMLGNLAMVDLNDYSGEMDVLHKLKPRALVETSPGNFQLFG